MIGSETDRDRQRHAEWDWEGHQEHLKNLIDGFIRY